LGFALNALWARVLFTLAAVAVAWFFMPALFGALWWVFLASALLITSALTHWRNSLRNRMDQMSEAFSESPAQMFAERLFDLLPLLLAVGCVAVLLRSLWLISH